MNEGIPITKRQKLLGLTNTSNSQEKQIVVSHITIRQSISVLVFRIILIEAIAAVAVIVFHTLILSTQVRDLTSSVNENFILFNIPIFVLLVIIKTVLVLFVIIQWLNEYYEITPKEIIHRKGLIFRSEQRYKLEHLGSLKIEQRILGRMFNYGNLRLYNWALEKDFLLYLIHNPNKYKHVLETLIPSADEEKEVLREQILEDKDE